MTVEELLPQYEARLAELQAGFAHARTHSAMAAVATAIAIILLLMLGWYAIRQRISFL